MDTERIPKTSEPELPPPDLEKDMVSTARGGGILMVGRTFNYFLRLGVTVLLAHLLTTEQMGLYNLAVSGATVAAAIAVFGLDTTIMRQIAIMRSRQDTNGLWGTIQVGLGASIFFSFFVATGLYALAYPIAENIFHEPRLVPLLQIASFTVPLLVMSDVLAGATRGFRNMSDTVIAQNIVQPLVRVGLIVLLALGKLEVWQTIVIFGFADLCASLVLLFQLNRKFNLRRSVSGARRDIRQVLGFSLPLWLSDLMTTFRGNLQTLLIGSLGTIEGVGIFSIANQVTLLGTIFHGSLNQSARPLIAELNDQGKRKQLEHVYQTTTRWVITINLPIILIALLFPEQIMSIFGKAYVAGATTLSILALVNLVHVATGMCGAILEMTGHTGLKLLNTTIRVSLAILMNFLLIPRYGIVGAALAALIHEVVANVLPLGQVWRLYHILPYSLQILKPLAASALAIGGGLLMRQILPLSSNVLVTASHILVVLGVYALTIRLMGFSHEDRSMIRQIARPVRLLFSRR
jgi:O-antigen/teichoic acid export membrane protein